MDDTTEFSSLMAGFRDGDPTAGAELYRRYGPSIRAAVRRQLHPGLRTRYDSLDFVHDVWASFLAMPSDRYAFDAHPALVAYLARVAQNKVVEVFRRRFGTRKDDIAREWRAGPDGPDPCDAVPGAAASPSQEAVAAEEWERMVAATDAGHRQILRLLRDGHTHEEIAAAAVVSRSTVSRLVSRLKERTHR